MFANAKITDIERIAATLHSKRGWFLRLSTGLAPKGLAKILRALHDLGDTATLRANAEERRAVKAEGALAKLRYEASTIIWHLDRLIEQYDPQAGTHYPRAGVILMSRAAFDKLDCEYICPDRKRVASGSRWAYTYRGLPVFTGAGFVGATIIAPEVFEQMRAGASDALKLMEK